MCTPSFETSEEKRNTVVSVFGTVVPSIPHFAHMIMSRVEDMALLVVCFLTVNLEDGLVNCCQI